MKKFYLFVTSFFLIFLLFSCGNNNEYTFKAIAPSGAPTIAQAYLEDNKGNKNISYSVDRINNLTLLQEAFTKDEYDVIYAPINLGVKFYNSNKKYKLLAGLTWGNLYFASAKPNLDISDLNYNDLYLFGKGSINEFIINEIFEKYNINPKSVTYLTSTAETTSYLAKDNNAICLIAEPSLSTISSKLNKKNVTINRIDVQLLWKSIHDDDYPQAAVFVKSDLFNDQKAISSLYSALEASVSFCNSNYAGVNEISNRLSYGLPEENILAKAIPASNIRLIKASLCKEAVSNLLKIMNIEAVDEEFFAF